MYPGNQTDDSTIGQLVKDLGEPNSVAQTRRIRQDGKLAPCKRRRHQHLRRQRAEQVKSLTTGRRRQKKHGEPFASFLWGGGSSDTG